MGLVLRNSLRRQWRSSQFPSFGVFPLHEFRKGNWFDMNGSNSMCKGGGDTRTQLFRQNRWVLLVNEVYSLADASKVTSSKCPTKYQNRGFFRPLSLLFSCFSSWFAAASAFRSRENKKAMGCSKYIEKTQGSRAPSKNRPCGYFSKVGTPKLVGLLLVPLFFY